MTPPPPILELLFTTLLYFSLTLGAIVCTVKLTYTFLEME